MFRKFLKSVMYATFCNVRLLSSISLRYTLYFWCQKRCCFHLWLILSPSTILKLRYHKKYLNLLITLVETFYFNFFFAVICNIFILFYETMVRHFGLLFFYFLSIFHSFEYSGAFSLFHFTTFIITSTYFNSTVSCVLYFIVWFP